jgi:hypothetical protein
LIREERKREKAPMYKPPNPVQKPKTKPAIKQVFFKREEVDEGGRKCGELRQEGR